MHYNLKELKVWQKAIDMAVEIYASTAYFPSDERYGLTAQIRQSVVEVSSTISEGAGSNSSKKFIRSIGAAQAALYELQTKLIIANKLNLISDSRAESLLQKIADIQQMSGRLKESLLSGRPVAVGI